MSFARRIRDVSPSLTLATSARASELRQQGVDVVNLSAGEPDFPTPESVIDAARPAFEEGRITYTAAAGMPQFRDAVARMYSERFGLDLGRDAVTIACGAKHALYLALQVLCDEGDEVLFASPYWVSYPEMARLAGAVPVTVETRPEDDFRLSAEAVRAAVTDRTRVLILNSPSNPTGAVMPRPDFEAVVAMAADRGIWVLSDEIYDQLYYGEPPTSLFQLGADALARALVINGVSKTYAMTGWRIGWAVGPAEVIKLMARLQSHETSNPNTLAQVAAMAAITGDQSVVAERRAIFDARRRLMLEGVRGWPGCVCPEPEGAFYLFPKVSSLYGLRVAGHAIGDSMALSSRLLDDVGVATVAGKAFGSDDCIRLSYATSAERIEEGLRRIAEFIGRLD